MGITTSVTFDLCREPPKPLARSWAELRAELKQFRLTMLVVNLKGDGIPTIKVTGDKRDIRSWLDQCGYRNVPVADAPTTKRWVAPTQTPHS